MKNLPNLESAPLSRYTAAFGLSLAYASVVNGLLVVAKEKSPAVMAGMKKLTGHHWITHSAIVVMLFLVMGVIFSSAHGGRGVKLGIHRLIGVLVGGVILGGLLILGFYLIAD
jgi:hypothetical protein